MGGRPQDGCHMSTKLLLMQSSQIHLVGLSPCRLCFGRPFHEDIDEFGGYASPW